MRASLEFVAVESTGSQPHWTAVGKGIRQAAESVVGITSGCIRRTAGWAAGSAGLMFD